MTESFRMAFVQPIPADPFGRNPGWHTFGPHKEMSGRAFGRRCPAAHFPQSPPSTLPIPSPSPKPSPSARAGRVSPTSRKSPPKTLTALLKKEDVEIPLIETLELIPEPDGSPTEDFVIPDGFRQR
jgi:hypothetical protein